MNRIAAQIRDALSFLWRTDKPLTFVGVLMTGALAASVVGLVVDPRTITGAPAWLKPAKFAISTAIYSFTLAWIFSYLPDWRRMRRWVGWTTSAVFVAEVAAIDMQAWRGTTSHFNVGTPFDAALFAAMGLAIVVQTIASAFVAIALWRQRFRDEVMGWALRAGMTITIVGALTGGLMTRPTAAQLADARATHRMAVAGAHTVGAPDGGPGLPGTGWSREHGDLRVPHFFGLHAVQALAILAIVLRRRGRLATGAMMRVAAASYLALYGILVWQALRAESLMAPTAVTVAVIGAWVAATAAAAAAAGRNAAVKPSAAALIA